MDNIALTLVTHNVLNDKVPSYCDREIKTFKDPIKNLESILNYKWVKTQELLSLEPFSEYHSVTYECNDIKLIGIDCEYEEEYNHFLILQSPHKIEFEYIIVGVVIGHPIVETNYVSYDNSDGSGPDLFEDLNDPVILAKNLVYYYHEFLNDHYH